MKSLKFLISQTRLCDTYIYLCNLVLILFWPECAVNIPAAFISKKWIKSAKHCRDSRLPRMLSLAFRVKQRKNLRKHIISLKRSGIPNFMYFLSQDEQVHQMHV